MPDFNFAGPQKDRQSREPEAIPAPDLSGAPAAPAAPGQTRSITADPLPADFDSPPPEPARVRRATAQAQQKAADPAPQAAAPDAAQGAAPAPPPRSSVLDAYPPRTRVAAPPTPAPPDDTAPPAGSATGGADATPGRRPMRRWLLALNIVFIAAILFSALWGLWYSNAIPGLTRVLRPVFGVRSHPRRPALRSVERRMLDSLAADTAAPPVPIRSWEYFVQVSSWSALRTAEADAARFKAAGMDAYVESEFYPHRRRTLYRVRIGPFDTREAARVFRTAQASRLPAGAFIDSMRVEDRVDSTAASLPVRSTAPSTARGSAYRSGARTSSGFAVKVSSFRDESVARNEARRLLEGGYPSFITRTRLDGDTWYRVLVGPFGTRGDAERYAQLLNVSHGNDAYVIDLARE